MAEIVYRIVEHDGGYAYRVGDTVSETFPSQQEARAAAERAAEEQQMPGSTEIIDYQDRRGGDHEEIAEGGDRPKTRVED